MHVAAWCCSCAHTDLLIETWLELVSIAKLWPSSWNRESLVLPWHGGFCQHMTKHVTRVDITHPMVEFMWWLARSCAVLHQAYFNIIVVSRYSGCKSQAGELHWQKLSAFTSSHHNAFFSDNWRGKAALHVQHWITCVNNTEWAMETQTSRLKNYVHEKILRWNFETKNATSRITTVCHTWHVSLACTHTDFDSNLDNRSTTCWYRDLTNFTIHKIRCCWPFPAWWTYPKIKTGLLHKY